MTDDKWIQIQFESLSREIKEIKANIKQIMESINCFDDKYVTSKEWKASFVPIRNLLYTVVGSLIVGLLLYYLKVVIK